MNPSALDFIKSRESCRLTAYRDSGGVWTVGWGATALNIGPGTVWTQAEADSDLGCRVAVLSAGVATKVQPLRLTGEQSAALVSFAYNVGMGAFASSHVLQFVLARDWLNAAKALLQWDHVAGVESIGLLKRRMEEAALFLDGCA